MNIFYKIRNVLLLLAFTLITVAINAQNFDEYRYNGSFNPEGNSVANSFQFNGYTKYWHDIRNNWITYGNLFKMASPDVQYSIAQSKVDIADDMGIPGLSVQEGFINYLLKDKYILIDKPSPARA